MTDLRHTYAEKAICQIPRLLSLQDRNPLSPTYGSFHRRYWLDKVDDFADGLTQFGVHSLALVYARHLPQNPYYEQPKMRDWIVAGLEYWAKIQHKDGTFDEFYPYERGWVGPTAFTTFAIVETVNLMKEKDALPPDVEERVRNAIRKAAHSIAQGESEEDSLANHHAMACLALWKAYKLLGDEQILAGYERIWQGFLHDYHRSEGWSLEYDGVDPGYLSATVSFLGKIYQEHPTDEMKKVLEQAVNFGSYFVYPNGYYAGSMGSRQTLHFYPHGFEILAPEIPLAAAVAERMLRGLSEGALVPPEIMADRYFLYRVPEFLLAYLDHAPRPEHLPPLPYQREPFRTYFSGAKIFATRTQRHYLLVNLAKGGVVKFFDVERERLLYNDCGILGQLADGTVVSSQWIDENYQVTVQDDELTIEGHLNEMPVSKIFTPFKTILFRAALVVGGWSSRFSHFLKGAIRRVLMLGSRPVPARFNRHIRLDGETLTVEDEITLEKNLDFCSLSMGGEFFVRYVPQSRYFQQPELEIASHTLEPHQLKQLSEQKKITIARVIKGERTSITSRAIKGADRHE
ncbi:MAG: hypothetical protein GY832_11080 [Chloroflexi bacterium]|nr:hypothetical protein [Chloroflexota bacterium]